MEATNNRVIKLINSEICCDINSENPNFSKNFVSSMIYFSNITLFV